MNSINRLIATCAILIAALTLLVPLGEMDISDSYADKNLASDSLVLSNEEIESKIDWNNCPIRLSYSLDKINWVEIPFFYEGYSLISYSIHENALDLSEMTDDDIIYMKAEPTSGYSAVSGESGVQIEKLTVTWQHTSLENVTLSYAGCVELKNNEHWSWQVPVSTLGKCELCDYLSIDFFVGGVNCLCNLYNNLNYQKISFLSLDSPRSIQSELDALAGRYVYGEQVIEIYKSGNEYIKRIVDEIVNGKPATNKIGDMYYILDADNNIESLVTLGSSNNVYMIINEFQDGEIISLTSFDDYTYSSETSGNISKGSVFEKRSTGISINGLEYPDIQTAIDCASDGNLIELDVGEYSLDKFITIDKSITLKGVIGDTKETSSVITGFQGSPTNQVNIRIIGAATLDSLWIDGGSDNIHFNGDNSKGIIGVIDLHNSNNAIIQNCVFIKQEQSSEAVAIYAGQGSCISNNFFEGWHKAIFSEVNSSASSISITDNIFQNEVNSNLYFINITLSNVLIDSNTFTNGKISNSSKVIVITKNIFNNVILNIYDPSTEIFENVISETTINNKRNEIIDLSANYWGGDKPQLDDSKFKVDSWFTTYYDDTRTLGGLTFEDNLSKIYVDRDNESKGDGTKDNPYQTISEALANVKYGQEIYVADGTYDEEILITSSLRNVKLLGSNYDNNANGKTWNQNGTILTKGICIETRAHEDPYPNIVDCLTIQGFNFQNKGFVVEAWWENGSISNIIIENNRFTDIDDGSDAAIHFNISSQMAVNNLTIKYNFIQNIGSDKTSPSGINILSAKGTVVIEGNFIKNTNHGSIQLSNQASGELVIQNNHLENWDNDISEGGRAFCFDNISINEITIRLNSIIQRADFHGEDLSDMYLKITNSETFIDASKNYWDGKDPTADDFPIYANDECIVIIHSWYTQYDPETNTLDGFVTDDVPGVVPDVPAFPDVPVIPEVPTPDENGDVSIEIPKGDIDKIVDDALSSGFSSVTITDVSDIKDALSVTISKENLQDILDKLCAEDSISEAVVKLPEGLISIGKDVLSSILETAEEKSITIKLSDAKDELNEAQKQVVGDRPVYNIAMLKGSEKITNFNGKTITVSISYELKENENPDNIVVYYVKDDGTIEKMDCVYKDGKVSFETNHLSYFAISYEVPEPVPEEPASNNSNTVYYAITVIVILLAIAAITYCIMKRKQ